MVSPANIAIPLLVGAGVVTVGAIALPEILAGKPIIPKKPKLAEPPEGLCGAYWYRGFAVLPYEVQKGKWGWISRGGNGTEALTYRTTENSAAKAIENARDELDVFLPEGALWQTGLYAPKNADKTLRVWGTGKLPANVDEYFCQDPNTNWIWVSKDCKMVVEGPYFEPITLDLDLDEEVASTLQKTLSISPTNSVYGYIDYLLSNNTLDSLEVTERVAKQMGCPINWTKDEPNDGIDRWMWDFLERINEYVAENGGIYFDPIIGA